MGSEKLVKVFKATVVSWIFPFGRMGGAPLPQAVFRVDV
jgi:hypothetical protein